MVLLFFVIELLLVRGVWLAVLVLLHLRALSDQYLLTCLQRSFLVVCRVHRFYNILIGRLSLPVVPLLLLAINYLLILITTCKLVHYFHVAASLLLLASLHVTGAAVFVLLLGGGLEVLVDVPGLSASVATGAVAVGGGAMMRLGLGLGWDGGQSGRNGRKAGIDGLRGITFLQ